MLDELIETLDDLDRQTVQDVADAIGEGVEEMADLVWEHRDVIVRVVALVRDRQEELSEAVAALPRMIAGAGPPMLEGVDGRRIAEIAERTLSRTLAELGEAARIMADVDGFPDLAAIPRPDGGSFETITASLDEVRVHLEDLEARLSAELGRT
ncbi:MAG: hypothetical protein R3290_12900 [Acidimicrobiia bacterium]|nr:hypothetical protein [Acidimicrobiia bacterium]